MSVKMGEWVMIMVVMMVFIQLVGITTPVGTMLSSLGITINGGNLDSTDLESSSLFGWIFGAVGLLTLIASGGTILIGLFGKGYDPSLALAPFCVSVGTLFVGTGFMVFTNTRAALGASGAWASNIIGLIFLAITTLFIFSCVDYFAGR